MHVCLLPTEILLYLFEFNTIEDCNWRPISVPQLAALARTCRAFKEPALDILWKDIHGFKPLISCLPEGIISTDTEGYLTFKRPLLDAEWRLIDRNARRIRSFTVIDSELDALDSHGMQAFMSTPSPTPLLPNLRILRWCDEREYFFPLLRTLLVSTITSIQLGSKSTPPSFAQSALLASLPGRCPSIQELDCTCVGDSTESSDAICEALYGLRELSRLDTGVLSTQEFFRLAALPSLKSLDFILRTYNIHEMPSDSTSTIFSQLNQVHLTAPSQSVVNRFTRSVRFPSCRSVTVDVDYGGLGGDPLDIPDLIVSLSECFSPALEELCVDFDFDFDFYEAKGVIANRRSYVLSFHAVAPLLSFNRLTDLQLGWMCTSDINDASLKTIAQSWPQLETLAFGGSARWLTPPSLTFVGLVHLIQHCRRLRMLQISFWACPVVFESEPCFTSIANEKITRLFVGMSPIVDSVGMAYELRRLLPKLTEVVFLDWLDEGIPVPPPFHDLGGTWNVVNEILGMDERIKRFNATGAHVAGLTDPGHIVW
ncbi:hypothetical protein DEU56DRAFT_790886 [Suillus clintonianus]|uniref:uncharacterized protein n=1 Tax=Suillus clintonianus TaxID=1904413 RepID=UPI001B8758F8|nr:uncharacterized protein DEU56DRAFT_790886 [Suillus clintonianus]KAG2144266.1 hypothetical protein DEU56DRAFT_790886 [Suillus clintonianus]